MSKRQFARTYRLTAVACTCTLLTAACVPTIDLARSPWKAPDQPWNGPTVQILVNHLTCEIANAYQKSKASNGLTPALWERLSDDHFIATVDLNLLVTHNESVNPNLSFITPLTAAGDVISPVIKVPATGQTATSATFNRTLSVGAQLSGTQDNTIDLQYVMDLQKIFSASEWYPMYLQARSDLAQFRATPAVAKDASNYPAIETTREQAIGGLEHAGDAIDAAENISDQDDKSLRPLVDFPNADPAAVEASAQKVVSKLELLSRGFAPCAAEPSRTFTMGLSGDLGLATTINDGLNAIDATGAYNIYGASGPATVADSNVPFPPQHTFGVAAAAAAAGGKGGSAPAVSNASGSASFSAKIDFNVVEGVSGGPNWTVLQFKGPTGGSGQMLGISRTAVDTLSMTFAPTCRLNKEVLFRDIARLTATDNVTFTLPGDISTTDDFHVLGQQPVPTTYLRSTRPHAELAFEQIQWSGVISKQADGSKSVMLVGTVSTPFGAAGGAGKPVGKISIQGVIPKGGNTVEAVGDFAPLGSITQDAVTALTGDGTTGSYWDTVQGCDVTAASAVQGVIDNAAAQTRFQRLPLSAVPLN